MVFKNYFEITYIAFHVIGFAVSGRHKLRREQRIFNLARICATGEVFNRNFRLNICKLVQLV